MQPSMPGATRPSDMEWPWGPSRSHGSGIGLPPWRRRLRWHAITALLAVSTAAFPFSGGVAQELRPLTTFGGNLDARALLLEHSQAALLPAENRAVIAPVGDGAQYSIYELDGRLVRVGGERGRGPGEIEGIRRAWSDGHRFVLTNGTWLWIDKDGVPGEPLGSGGSHNDLAFVGRDSMLISRTARFGDRILLLSISDGTTLRTYFPVDPEERDVPLSRFAIMSGVTRHGEFVASSVATCTIHFLNLDPELETRPPKDAGPWCQRWEAPYDTREPEDRPPRARIIDLQLLDDGSVWIIGAVADEDWQPGDKSIDESWDTMVEIVPPRGDRSRRRLPGAPRQSPSGPYVMTAQQDDRGVVSLTIWSTRARW